LSLSFLVGKSKMTLNQSEKNTRELECQALIYSGNPLSIVSAPVKRSKTGLVLESVALGWQPKKRVAIPDAPRCVVVATGGNLGGAILSLPLIKATRKRFPNAHLAVITNTDLGRELVEFAGVYDSIHLIAGPKPSLGSPALWAKSLLALRRLRPEVLVSNHDDVIGRWLWPLRIPVRLGNVSGADLSRPQRWDRFFTHPVPHDISDGWLVGYERISQELGAIWPGLPELKPSTQERTAAASSLRSTGVSAESHVVAFQVGVWSPQAWKQWPTNLLSEAIKSTWGDHKAHPVLVGAPDSIESAESIVRENPDIPIVSLVGKTNVAEAAALLAECDAVVSNDSGLMHLGAAVGTPTIGVYGMTDPAVTWPYGAPHKIVRRTDCQPCLLLPSTVLNSCSHRTCLTTLSPSLVVNYIAEIIGQPGRTAN
jgi:ADP-heptose:LPS heptosyltransferase